ncbi:GntR family transcriptional regulator [Ahrensia kielensis]|uniref:GntR family transcriptional regulator n=1 Tax=Ahrensia kielensis TaxID=76980 RepID=A0ABU9T2K8_9HYPH
MNTNTHRDRSELLAEALSEEIIDGRLRPGEKLNEADLSERFAVSRGPIREALKRLGERKLVVFYPNAGARVITHTLSDILNLLEVREYLEAAAAKLAAIHMTPAEKQQLRNLYEAHTAAVASTPDGSYLQHPEDLDFHYVIIKGSKNPLLFDLLCGDLYPKLRISRRAHKASPGRGARALEEHRRILVAIEEGDPEFAELLMRKHIAAAREGLRKIGEFPSD